MLIECSVFYAHEEKVVKDTDLLIGYGKHLHHEIRLNSGLIILSFLQYGGCYKIS